MAHQFSGSQLIQRADEVPIDVVGVILVFGERAIGENFADSDRPELPGESLEIIEQLRSPKRAQAESARSLLGPSTSTD